MSRYITVYCDNPAGCGSSRANSAEIELPDHLADLGDSIQDLEAWLDSNLESLGWGKRSSKTDAPPASRRRSERNSCGSVHREEEGRDCDAG